MTDSIWNNRTVLITGGTGSFGTKLTEILLREYNPKSIRIFSRGEKLQQEVRLQFSNDPKLRWIIGDVRDRAQVFRALYDADIVVHAGALKQIEACEQNPIEAINTNIMGSINIVDAAIFNEVERIIGLSSDKAVYPTLLYGATKMVMEKLIAQSNIYVGTRKTRLSCCRYGNISGSRGSVIPLFMEQKKTGMITITDERMTRFWITRSQVVRFVMKCAEVMLGGEVFIPVAPSIKITDLADAIAPEAKRRVTGPRPSEKLHETLITPEEARHTMLFDGYYRIAPEVVFRQSDKFVDGQPLPDGFSYASNNNTQWLSKSDLERMIKEL